MILTLRASAVTIPKINTGNGSFVIPLFQSLIREETMLTGQGILLGIALFAFGTIIYVYMMIRGSLAQATGTTALMSWTVMNVYYWLALVVALILGCAIIRFWRSHER